MNKLNELGANVAVLNQKVYNLHWNAKGPGFMEIHKMTEALFEKLTLLLDQISEKIVMHKSVPFATFKEYLANSTIQEIKPKSFSYGEIGEIIVEDLNTLEKIALKVEGIHNIQPLLDEVFILIDEQRWFFRSTL